MTTFVLTKLCLVFAVCTDLLFVEGKVFIGHFAIGPVHSVQYTLYCLQCTLYCVLCIVYSVHNKVYSVQCTVYTTKYTSYIQHSICIVCT